VKEGRDFQSKTTRGGGGTFKGNRTRNNKVKAVIIEVVPLGKQSRGGRRRHHVQNTIRKGGEQKSGQEPRNATKRPSLESQGSRGYGGRGIKTPWVKQYWTAWAAILTQVIELWEEGEKINRGKTGMGAGGGVTDPATPRPADALEL